MKRLIPFILFYVIATQTLVCQSPVECGEELIVIVYESQLSSVNLQNCHKDLLITTIDSNIEIVGAIQINEDFGAHILPTENYKINLKPGYSQRGVPGKKVLEGDGDDGDGKEYFKIYPSPADTFIVLQTENIMVLSYTISDVYGVVHLQGNTPANNTIFTTSLPRGIYYVSIQTATQIITEIFTKN